MGSLVGSAAASAVFIASGQSYVTTFTAAIVPPVLALAWLVFVFRADLRAPPQGPASLSDDEGALAQPLQQQSKNEAAPEPGSGDSPLHKVKLLVKAFKSAYWQALLVVAVLYFGRFDFAWVTLRAQTVRFCLLGAIAWLHAICKLLCMALAPSSALCAVALLTCAVHVVWACL